MEKYVQLVASGYEFICPGCGHFNRVIEVTETVICERCEGEFEVGEIGHAYESI